ncbi:MAG: DNA-3-methyladenine glycosylase 2 [Bacillota bacterium]
MNLAATLECGQAFRWRKACFPGRPDLVAAYTGVIPVGRTTGTARREIVSASEIAPCSRITPRQLAVYVGQAEPVTSKIMVAYDPTYAQDDTGLAEPQPCACSHGEQPADPPPVGHISDAVRLYFAADDDVAAIEAEVARLDSVMAGAVKEAHGLRILRQDHWECLASYVLSINNNIPNISRIVEHFSLCLGEPVGLGLHSFPPPEKIACQDSGFLRQSKCGFRDRYLKDAAERVASGEVDLTGLERMPTEQARERLMRIRGVGPKVADCVLLFGYHRLDVFPSDVWISRAMSRYYLGGGAVTPKMAREEGMRRFGPLAGYAQEYLFWRARGDDSLR